MARQVKAWCLFIDDIPEIDCLSHSREKVRRMAVKAYQSNWKELALCSYTIRMVWVSERKKGERDVRN